MISVNGAVEIDLLGQVSAETVRGMHFSGIGGQVDYVRGAQMSKGGKSFIATESTYGSGDRRGSRIVSRLSPGAVVTTSSADVQYVATEYGCVNLKTLTITDRIRAMISIAHSDYRDQLLEEAKQKGLL
jgi:4-hydroxybutyrate CoA-transferase